MEYQVGDFRVDVTRNQIISHDGEERIRPKTLALLCYFLEHQGEVLTKQTLLDQVWKRTGAQEHLLFQSIKELRSLFAPLNVIKTHPGTGYQWIAPLQPASSDKGSQQTTVRTYSPLYLVGIFCVLSLLMVAGVNLIPQKSTESTLTASSNQPAPSRELVVLPFETAIDGNGEDWVRLGAMDIMIKKLRSLGQFAVPDAEEVMMAISRGNAFAIDDVEQKSYAIRTQIGESVTVHSKLYGAPMEYQLHYSLIGRFQVKQGIVFGESVTDLLDSLGNEILTYYQLVDKEDRLSIAQQAADYTLLQSMEFFHQGQMDKAGRFFKTYLESSPLNIAAKRYLLKVKIASGEYSEALEIGQEALAQANEQNNAREQVRVLFELGVLASLQNDFPLAKQRLENSRALADANQDELYAAFAYTQLGHLMAKEKQYSQAEEYYQTALTYHEGFRCPYGQISNLHALSMLFAQQRDNTQAEVMLDKALIIAKTNQITHEHAHLLLNKIAKGVGDPNRHAWLEQAYNLIIELENPDQKAHFLARLDALKTSTVSSLAQ